MILRRHWLRSSLLFIVLAIAAYQVANISQTRDRLRNILLHSEAYKAALSFVGNASIVQQQLGEPEHIALSSSVGSFWLSGTEAEMALLVDGRRRSGTVFLRLQKRNGAWSVSKGKLRLDSNHFLPIR